MLWESKMLVGFKQGPPQISTKGLAKSEEEDMIPSLISYSDSDCHTVIIFLLSQLPYVQEESDYRFPFSHHHLFCSKLPGRLQQQRSEFKFSLCHMLTCQHMWFIIRVNLRMTRFVSWRKLNYNFILIILYFYTSYLTNVDNKQFIYKLNICHYI